MNMSQNPERSEAGRPLERKPLKLSSDMIVIQLDVKRKAVYNEDNLPLPDVAVYDVNTHGEDKQQTKKG